MPLAFTASLDTFRRLIDRVGKVVEKRNTIPILSNVLLAVKDDGRLAVTGTDLDAAAYAYADAGEVEITAPGATTVPAQLLSDILRKLPKGAAIRFESTEKEAVLSAGRSRFRLHELPAIDFPDISPEKMPTSFELAPAALRQIVNEVGFAISTEETRYYLNGVFLHAKGGDGDPDARTLTAVATDGHRLSLLRLPVTADIAAMPGVIVPQKTVKTLFPHIAEACPEGQHVAVTVGERNIALETPGLRIVSKLIDGTFPDYQRVIPTANAIRVEVDTEKLEQAVDRVASISNERGSAVKLNFGGGNLLLTVLAPDAGQATDEVPLLAGEDVEIEIGFNSKYLVDALQTYATARVELAMQDAGTAAILRKPEDTTRLVVLMPMRV